MLFFPLWPFSQDLYNLLPKQDVFLIHRTVVVEVSEEPVFIFHPLVYYLQELSEMIRFIVAVYRQGNTGGSTVGDHIVCLPSCPLQRFQCGTVFFIRGQLFRPPGAARIRNLCLPVRFNTRCLAWKFRSRRIQDAVFYIVALGPAIVKKVLPLIL